MTTRQLGNCYAGGKVRKAHEALTSLKTFLRTGKANYCVGKDGAVVDYSSMSYHGQLAIHDRWVFRLGYGTEINLGARNSTTWSAATRELFATRRPIGRLLKGRNGNAYMLLLNGDMGQGHDIVEIKDSGLRGPTVSFTCLGRFLVKDGTHEAGVRKAWTAAVNRGDVVLEDFTADTYRSVSQELIEAESMVGSSGLDYDSEKPGPGYTLVRAMGTLKWHRPAAALFYIKSENMTILVGIDENQYFGCELPTHVTTLAAAYKALIPAAAKNKQGNLLPGVRRQGEWFVIPVATAKVPRESQCFMTEVCVFPREQGGNTHRLAVRFDDCLRIANSKAYSRNFILTHDQHATIDVTSDAKEQWYTFECNTAKRSFSEDGVD